VRLFSFQKLAFVKSIDYGQTEIKSIKASRTCFCTVSDKEIDVYSIKEFQLLFKITDVMVGLSGAPIFDIASRSMAYSTSSPIQRNKETVGDLAIKTAQEIVFNVFNSSEKCDSNGTVHEL
jgi:hypothetical protein